MTKEVKRRLISPRILNFPYLVTKILDVPWFASSRLWAEYVDFFCYLTRKASSLPDNFIAVWQYSTGMTVIIFKYRPLLEAQSTSEVVAQITQNNEYPIPTCAPCKQYRSTLRARFEQIKIDSPNNIYLI